MMADTLPTATDKPHHLDDVMLAMDVVDTLRHDRAMVARDMGAVERREDLIARLRGIYQAQGIDVPDSVLMDGVLALEEQRFAYTPPKPGLGTSLARLYIRRRKWLPLIYTLSFIIGSVAAVNYVGFVRPAQVQQAQVERLLSKELPEQISELSARGTDLAATPALQAQVISLADGARTAIAAGDARDAQARTAQLAEFVRVLGLNYDLRIVSRFNEASGVYLDSKVNADIRNFYLIVEAVDNGNVIALDIEDEDYKTISRVDKFGVRVPKAVFDAVAADKRDDQIIQNDILGTKPRGAIDPVLNFDGADSFVTGYIVEW